MVLHLSAERPRADEARPFTRSSTSRRGADLRADHLPCETSATLRVGRQRGQSVSAGPRTSVLSGVIWPARSPISRPLIHSDPSATSECALPADAEPKPGVGPANSA